MACKNELLLNYSPTPNKTGSAEFTLPKVSVESCQVDFFYEKYNQVGLFF
jgi:hypothetical protein